TGNLLKGSTVMGCSSLSTSAEQAMRARPLIRMAQDPHTSSRQFESYAIGVVALPSRVTGLSAISIMAEITFIPGFQVNSNSSQRGWVFGFSCLLIFKTTVF